MKIAELEKKKKELGEELEVCPEDSLLPLAKFGEVLYRLCVSYTISRYYHRAKRCHDNAELKNPKRNFKALYKTFAKYVNTLPYNFYFTPTEEEKKKETQAATEKFLAVLAGISDRAENAKFETKEEFFESFKMDSLSVNIAFNEFRDKFIKIN